MTNEYMKKSKAELRALAIQTVGTMNYDAICAVCPRREHWRDCDSEQALERKQIETAIESVYEDLLKHNS